MNFDPNLANLAGRVADCVAGTFIGDALGLEPHW
jgi:hypothetical protein